MRVCGGGDLARLSGLVVGWGVKVRDHIRAAVCTPFADQCTCPTKIPIKSPGHYHRWAVYGGYMTKKTARGEGGCFFKGTIGE